MSSRGVPALQGEGGLSRYLSEIRKFPLLEPEEEYMFAKRWREHDDPEAARRLVTSHLRLVAKIAMGYRGYGLPVSEIVAEGNVGLMQAVKRFEPDRGFRLATYAMWWIRAAIQEYILRSWSQVKMGTTAAQKKLFFNLRKVKSRIGALDEGDMRPEQVREIADKLAVPEEEVVNMNRRLAAPAGAASSSRGEGAALCFFLPHPAGWGLGRRQGNRRAKGFPATYRGSELAESEEVEAFIPGTPAVLIIE